MNSFSPDDASTSPVKQGPLSGMTVLDLSRVLAGPWASQTLGDLGADVIKVEKPGDGDDTRGWGPPFLFAADGRSDAAYYLCCNRNKKSIAIDFSQPEGRRIVQELAKQADIIIENFKTGGLVKYGLDYSSLSTLNPSLIYCSITGFGQFGPYSQRGGYDFLVQGMSGLMSVTGHADGQPGAGPVKVGIPVCDLFAGQYAVISILAAVTHRLRTGEGQYIDCALLDSQIAMLVNQAMNHLVGGTIPQRLGNAHPNVVPYRDFATADGNVLVAVGNDSQFKALCRLLGREDLACAAQFATNEGRNIHRTALEAELTTEIVTWRSRDLLSAMSAVGVPGGPINRIDEILADPHVVERGLLHTLRRRDGVEVPVIGFPAQLSRSPASYRRAPPCFGENTAEVLVDILGMQLSDVERLADAGIIFAGETPSKFEQAIL